MSDNKGGVVMPNASTEVNLKDIIRERKAERKLKAEEKRQKDLQRIKDMKSTSGIDPLQRFPKEVWEMIFNELDPEDRENAYQVHPMFRDLLEKNKVRDILFPQIIKLPEFQEHYDYEYNFKSYSSLRGISKCMRNSVDRWAEDNLTKRIRVHGMVFSDGRLTSNFLLYESDNERDDVKQLLACFEDGKRKMRFFVRAITIHFPSAFFINDYDEEITNEQRVQDILEEYKTDIAALLEIIGDQILHFCFQFPGRRTGEREVIVSPDEAYILLQRWTSLMPNLKWLQVQGMYPGEKCSVSWSVLKEYPFPHLKSLERINFECGQFWDFILGANRHVKQLYFVSDDSHLPLLPNHLIRSLPITSFSVATCDRSSDSSKLSFRMFECPLINLNWKLEGIKLELEDPSVSMNEVLKFLKNFPTLENVSLEFKSKVRIGYNGNFDYLTLPNLTDLKLDLPFPDINYGARSNIHFMFSLQFLLNCSKLKTLKWKTCFFDESKLRKHLKRHEYQSRGKSLDFRAGLRILYRSNIWDVFPSLARVETQGWKRSRGMPCTHEYLREDVIDGMSVDDFVKVHGCCRYDTELGNCVILFS